MMLSSKYICSLFTQRVLYPLSLGNVAVVNNYSFNNIIIYQVASHSFKRTPTSILMTKMQFSIAEQECLYPLAKVLNASAKDFMSSG
ncbi:MAG: hypothetical protein MZV70_26210 [Desulfobacterales bacterium]|nr:hypothetical protein [Desulfobacterales bacterium]